MLSASRVYQAAAQIDSSTEDTQASLFFITKNQKRRSLFVLSKP